MTEEIETEDEPKRLADRIEGLRWRWWATLRIWRLGADPEVPELEPELPAPVSAGNLDPPVDGGVVRREPITFHGWARFPSGPVSQVELWLGEVPLGRARLGMPRPDVSQALELSLEEAPGFELTVNLESWPGENGEAILRAVATSIAGEELEIEPLPLRIVPAMTTSAPTVASHEHTPLASRGSGLRTLIVAHQLDLGGAQLYLMDLLRELLRTEAVNPTVLAARDGQLRGELEELGVPVHISGVSPPEGLSAHLGRVEELAAWAADRDFEVAFVNTATSHTIPGVEVAGRLGIPTIWAIHESYEPKELWSGLDPAVRRRAEVALAEVDQTLFVAAATQRLFEPVTGAGRGRTIPYGLDLEPIERHRRGFDHRAARAEAGLPADADVVLCVGSIEPRKAQVQLVQAFDLLATRHPRARLLFLGGLDEANTHFLAGFAASRATGERIEIIPMTLNVQPWFGIADMLICPSDIESMPRTVLEAMAWETPVLATGIFGLPDLIEDGESGWLCEPRDLAALTAALDRALSSSPEERRRIGRAGRSLVESRHSLEDYGRQVADLLEAIAGGPRFESLVDAAAGSYRQ